MRFRGFACRDRAHVFSTRAERLRRLSESGAIGRAIGDYLRLMAALADAQQAALATFEATLPSAEQIAHARDVRHAARSCHRVAARGALARRADAALRCSRRAAGSSRQRTRGLRPVAPFTA